MPSTFARIRMIADMPNSIFWGSNPEEQKLLGTIRKEYAQYLYAPSADVPADVLSRLGSMADKVFETDTGWDDIVNMYEED